MSDTESIPDAREYKITEPTTFISYGDRLRLRLADEKKNHRTLPFVGIYDVFSAGLASKYFEAVFCSGYCFSASYYGLPDKGFITWTDMANYVERMRMILPNTHIAVDIDDGYGAPDLVEVVIRRMEMAGASMIILEDQQRPKKCGHLPGKEVVSVEKYCKKLKAALKARDSLFIVARTDADTLEEGIRRACIYASLGVDAVMVEGLNSLEAITTIRNQVPSSVRLLVNMVEGGKTPTVPLTELAQLGGQLCLWSMPMLFAAHHAMEKGLKRLVETDGETTRAADATEVIALTANNTVLNANQSDFLPQTRERTEAANTRRRRVELDMDNLDANLQQQLGIRTAEQQALDEAVSTMSADVATQ